MKTSAELIAIARENARKMLAEQQAKREANKAVAQSIVNAASQPTAVSKAISRVFTNNFTPVIAQHGYNEQQTDAIELGMQGKSFCLIGAAGTGKTTTTREIIAQIMRMSHIFPIQKSTKWLEKDKPAIIVVGFTNKAVNNLKRNLPPELRDHCMTVHKVIEFEPERDMSGKIIGFSPTRNKRNPLPPIAAIISEESSMTGTDLWKLLMNALPEGNVPQTIFLGDLYQLPPIFGPSILGFKLVDLPVVELTEVYRQALKSPIITLATRIKEGKGLPWSYDATIGAENTTIDAGEDGKVVLKPWRRELGEIAATKTMGQHFVQLIARGEYDPDYDMILCPFNKGFGTLELNKFIAQYLGQKRGEKVYEIVSRAQKHYLAVGDRVLVDRQEAIIKRIHDTVGYTGQIAQPATHTLDRWGVERGTVTEQDLKEEMDAMIDSHPLDILDSYMDEQMTEEAKKNLTSHTVVVEFLDTGFVKSISSSGDMNKIVFSYALTVHKSQGSEWGRVFLALHKRHNTMLTRELLYTAVTRAKKELIIYFEPSREGKMDSITRAARNPEIKGTTLQDKIEYFRNLKKVMKEE